MNLEDLLDFRALFLTIVCMVAYRYLIPKEEAVVILTQ